MPGPGREPGSLSNEEIEVNKTHLVPQVKNGLYLSGFRRPLDCKFSDECEHSDDCAVKNICIREILIYKQALQAVINTLLINKEMNSERAQLFAVSKVILQRSLDAIQKEGMYLSDPSTGEIKVHPAMRTIGGCLNYARNVLNDIEESETQSMFGFMEKNKQLPNNLDPEEFQKQIQKLPKGELDAMEKILLSMAKKAVA